MIRRRVENCCQIAAVAATPSMCGIFAPAGSANVDTAHNNRPIPVIFIFRTLVYDVSLEAHEVADLPTDAHEFQAFFRRTAHRPSSFSANAT
jgi:hypothetical protein